MYPFRQSRGCRHWNVIYLLTPDIFHPCCESGQGGTTPAERYLLSFESSLRTVRLKRAFFEIHFPVSRRCFCICVSESRQEGRGSETGTSAGQRRAALENPITLRSRRFRYISGVPAEWSYRQVPQMMHVNREV